MLPALLLAAAASAAPPPEACLPYGDLGCYYLPEDAGAHPPLLIYLRGFYADDRGSVPPQRRLQSARQAFAHYGLGELADSRRLAVLVTGSSHLPVTEPSLAALQHGTGASFGRRFLASHSGGWLGLSRSLEAGLRFDRLILLDNFYFPAALAGKIEERLRGGSTCAGYLTEHNRARYRERFEGAADCAVEPHDEPGYGHDATVARCLGTYLEADRCP